MKVERKMSTSDNTIYIYIIYMYIHAFGEVWLDFCEHRSLIQRTSIITHLQVCAAIWICNGRQNVPRFLWIPGPKENRSQENAQRMEKVSKVFASTVG